jgi:hypothetical protein
MADREEINKMLMRGSGKPPEPPVAVPPRGEEEEDLGPCAARAKDRWVTALTIKHPKKAWESFQYSGIATHSVFTPTKFEVVFIGHEERWRITVTGRNLWHIYNHIVQHRCEWVCAADRDFAEDGQPIILGIEVVEIREGED